MIVLNSPISPSEPQARLALPYGAFIAIGVVLAGCGEPPPPQKAGPVEVGIVTLSAQPVSLQKEVFGRTGGLLVFSAISDGTQS